MTVSVLDREIVLKAVSGGLRLDARASDEYRPVSLVFSTKHRGQVVVQIGETKYVSCGNGGI